MSHLSNLPQIDNRVHCLCMKGRSMRTPQLCTHKSVRKVERKSSGSDDTETAHHLFPGHTGPIRPWKPRQMHESQSELKVPDKSIRKHPLACIKCLPEGTPIPGGVAGTQIKPPKGAHSTAADSGICAMRLQVIRMQRPFLSPRHAVFIELMYADLLPCGAAACPCDLNRGVTS